MSINILSYVRNCKFLSRLPVSNFNSINSFYTCAVVNANIKANVYNYYPILKDKLLQSGEKFCLLQQTRYHGTTLHHINQPDPATYKKNCFFKVTYPADGKYTIKRLKLTKLGGRDPDTGRVIFGKVGGGTKRHYRWVLYDRCPPGSKDPLEERVIHVQYDPNRSAKIALVGHEDKLRFIIATTSMAPGDLIKSTREIPRIPVVPKEGDAHCVGALPNGTVICCVELLPHGPCIKLAGGSSAVVSRRLNDKVIIQATSLKEYAVDPRCLAVVGQVSMRNKPIHPIGSPQRMRWLGKRPASGLWQRKDGRYGRKYKQKKLEDIEAKPEEPKVMFLTLTGELPDKEVIPKTKRVT